MRKSYAFRTFRVTEITLTGYVLDSSAYGFAAFRVAGAFGAFVPVPAAGRGRPAPARGPALPNCCCSNYLSQALTQLTLYHSLRKLPEPERTTSSRKNGLGLPANAGYR